MSPINIKISTLLLAALALTSHASPTPQANDPIPAIRSSKCASKGATLHTEWVVYVVNTTMPSDQGSGSWAGGFLDNINGAPGCWPPTSWQAILDSADPQGVGCTFNTPLTCQTDSIVDAIHAASSERTDYSYGEGQWVYCGGDTLSDLFDGTGQLLEGLTEELGAVAGMLEGFGK